MRLNVDKIETRRKQLNLNQREFSELLKITPAYYCLILKNNRKAISCLIIEGLYFHAGMSLKDIFDFTS